LVQTVAELFYESLKFDLPDALASKVDGAYRPLSHRVLQEKVERLALALEARGLRPGDRVGILCENRPEWAITDFACAVMGLVSVPIYPTLNGEQTALILRHSGARWVLCSSVDQLLKVQEQWAGLPELRAPSEAQPNQPTSEFDRDSYAESKRAASAGKLHVATRVRGNVAPAGRKLARSSDGLAGVAAETPALTPLGQTAAGKGGGAAVPSSRKDEERRGAVAKAGPGTGAAESASTNRWAEPPPRAAAAPVASAAAPAALASPPAKKAKAVADLDEMQKSAADEGFSRPAEPEKAYAPSRMPTAEHAARTEAPADKKAASGNKETLSFEERVRKAEKLFAEKKWEEAAAAFRALLAQAPSNPSAKTWRERVAAADQAQERARAARTRKAVSEDPLDGM